MWKNENYYKALVFAESKHRQQKMIQPNGAPYIIHPISVAMLAFKYSANLKLNLDLIVVAALLHDTIEDTQTTLEEIEKEFGKDVAKGVLSLTRDEKLPEEKQIEDSVNRISKLPKNLVREIAIVKMSDRLFNLNNYMPIWDKAHREEYMVEANLILKKLGWASAKLKRDILQVIKEYQK